MILDVTGVELIPGNEGRDCPGNGEHIDRNGELIECCCDECDYMLCCTDVMWDVYCAECSVQSCPRFFVRKGS